MTLLAYVNVGDAIVCMADSKTTDDSGNQTSDNTVKLLTQRVGLNDATALAVVMVCVRGNFTPGGDQSSIPVPAIEVVRGAIEKKPPSSYRALRDLGDAIWPTIRHRMVADRPRCAAARENEIRDNAARGFPLSDAEKNDLEAECDSFIDEDGYPVGHDFALHIAGFEQDGPERKAMRYWRKWNGHNVKNASMRRLTVYHSAQERHENDLPEVRHDDAQPINSDSRVITDLKATFLKLVEDYEMQDVVGGVIRTKVMYPAGQSSDFDWYFETGKSVL